MKTSVSWSRAASPRYGWNWAAWKDAKRKGLAHMILLTWRLGTVWIIANDRFCGVWTVCADVAFIAHRRMVVTAGSAAQI